MKNSKRIWSMVLVLIFLFVSVPVSSVVVSSADKELASAGEAPVYYIETYEQLRNHASKAQAGYRYILNADIEQVDNENDLEIVIPSGACFNLDLNGYSIKRSTQGNDCALFRIKSDASMLIYDTSDFSTGYCSFSEGYSSYYKAVFYNDGGELEINGGYYEILSPYEQGDCSVVRTASGSTYIYDGTFDSSASWGGDTISVGHNAYLYEVPQVVIFGGDFYGKYMNIEVTPFDNYLNYGCLFPSVYVLGGNFYVTNGGKDGDDASFAYCNNGWGRVIVAEGIVLSKCLNARDQIFLHGVSKKLFSETIDDYTGGYYEVTAPPMIMSDNLDYYYRLINLCKKEEVRSYEGYSVVEQYYGEEFEYILGSIDTIVVTEEEKESPDIELVNRTIDHKYIRWYMCNESSYNGEDTQWTYLGDFDDVSFWTPDERPEEGGNYLVRCVVTNSDLTTYEDLVRIAYEPLKTAETVTSVEVIGLDAPVKGANPDFDLTPADDSFNINAVYWTDATDSKNRMNMKETDTFEAGHTYELEVWIRANEDYRFTTDSDGWAEITASIGGKAAEVIGPGSAISAELLITFTVEGNTDVSTSPTEPSGSTNPTVAVIIGILGDADCDTKVNIKDVTAIQKHIAGLTALSDKGLTLADADGNENVNIKDATAIQKYIAGIDTGYPIGNEV